MMYDPHSFTLNLEQILSGVPFGQILSGVPLDTAIGVLQVVVRSACDIKGSKIGGGAPDPYVSLTLNGELSLPRPNTNSTRE
jgi:Ca2+-dependent lipid-binding protein